MAVYIYHGEDTGDSYAHFQAKIDELRRQDVRITTLDGKKAILADLAEALEQPDLFGGARAVCISGLFSRPKSKIRDEWCRQIASAPIDVLIWTDKKLTPAALKALPSSIIYASREQKAIWEAVALLSADNNNERFINAVEKAIQQTDQNSDPGIYLTATFLWQIQQLIDTKLGHFRGSPFARTRLQNQAAGLTLAQLTAWHQALIELDFRAKTGQLPVPASKELIFILTATI